MHRGDLYASKYGNLPREFEQMDGEARFGRNKKPKFIKRYEGQEIVERRDH